MRRQQVTSGDGNIWSNSGNNECGGRFGGNESGRQAAVAFNAGHGLAATMNGQAAGGGGNEYGGPATVDKRSAAAMKGQAAGGSCNECMGTRGS